MATLNLATSGVLNITIKRRSCFDVTIGVYSDEALTTLVPLTGSTIQLDVRSAKGELLYRFGGDGDGTAEVVAGRAHLLCLDFDIPVAGYFYDLAVKDTDDIRTFPVSGTLEVIRNYTELP